MMRRQIWRKASVAVGAMSVTAALVAGCSASPSTSSGSASTAASCAPSKGKVVLQYWNWVPGMDKVISLWNKSHPNIQVEMKNIANNSNQQITNALKAGQQPELAQVGYDELPNYREQNALEDVSACTAAVAAAKDFVPWTWSQATFNGQGIYAFPQDTGPQAMFYRADLFEKYHIPVPTTWAQYAQDALTLKRDDPKLDITFFDPSNGQAFEGLLWQADASMYSYTNGKWQVSLDSANAKQVADYWQKLINEKVVRTDLTNSSTAMYNAYANGQLATMISASWGYSLLRDNVPSQSGDWRVAPLPSWTAGTASSGDWGGSTVAFLKGDKDLYEAVEFNLWLETNPQALALENSLGGLYPASTAGQSLPQLTQGVAYYGGQKIFDVFKQAASQINTSWTWGPTQDAADTSLQNALIASVNGNGTLSGALAQAQTATINTMQGQAIPVEAAK